MKLTVRHCILILIVVIIIVVYCWQGRIGHGKWMTQGSTL